MQLTVQEWMNITAQPNAELVGSSVSGISSAFAASLAHKACLLSAKKNKTINWEKLAAISLSLQDHFIDIIGKDKLAFSQYLNSKNNPAQRLKVQLSIADNLILLMDYNIQLIHLSEQALPHSNIFLKSDFLIVCQLAKAGFYGANALLDSDLKTFKNFPQGAEYQQQANRAY